MRCENIKCPYYRKAEKSDWFEKMMFGAARKRGGCDKPYCKLLSKRKKVRK